MSDNSGWKWRKRIRTGLNIYVGQVFFGTDFWNGWKFWKQFMERLIGQKCYSPIHWHARKLCPEQAFVLECIFLFSQRAQWLDQIVRWMRLQDNGPDIRFGYREIIFMYPGLTTEGLYYRRLPWNSRARWNDGTRPKPVGRSPISNLPKCNIFPKSWFGLLHHTGNWTIFVCRCTHLDSDKDVTGVTATNGILRYYHYKRKIEKRRFNEIK